MHNKVFNHTFESNLYNGSVKNLSHFLKIQMARQSVKVFVLNELPTGEPCHVYYQRPPAKESPGHPDQPGSPP